MATYTSHYNLTKPAGTEKVNIGIINANMDAIDTAIYNNAQSIVAEHGGLAISSNNNTHAAVASGQYVYVYNHSSLSEGLYVAKAAISANAALSLSNLTAVSGGGLNHVFSTLNSTIVNVINPGGLSNNERYLPKNLGTITAANINDFVSSYGLNTGNYKDIYPGCYIHIGDSVANTDWMVGGLGIKHNSGDTAMGHGAEFIPRNQGFAYGTQMNDSNTTAGGYKGSAMHTYLTGTVAPALQAILGSHLLNQQVQLTNAVDTAKASQYSGWTGMASGWEWTDAKAVLMSEVEVYGSTVWGGPYDVGEARTKLPVFNFISPVEFGRGNFWLRAVASSAVFARCNSYGGADCYSAGGTGLYVRPLIRIG